VNNKSKTILCILIVLYLILELLSINLGGVYSDEAYPACGSLQVLKQKGPFMISFKLFNRYFPFMLCDYHSALESYILLPFFILFGINVIALRLCPIIFEMFSLIFLYIFLKELFNKKVAFITLFLLIINSLFLYFVKTGLNTASLLHFASITSLFLLWKWYKQKKNIYFYLAALLLGIGISIRSWFLWFVNALIILSILFINKLKDNLKKKILRYTIFGVLFFSLGIILFIIYNFKSNFATVRYTVKHFRRTHTEIDNLKYLSNLSERKRTFKDYISIKHIFYEEGSWSNRFSWKKNIAVKNTTSFTVFFTSFIYLIFSIIFKEGLFSYKRKLFIILIFILIFLQSPLTLSHLGGPHLFILYPFIQIIEAIGIVELIELFKKSKTMLAIMSCILLIFIFEEINATFRNNYLYFLKTGGSGNNSDAIYSLTKWLKENKYYAPVTLDWGMYHNIIFISKGEIVPITQDYNGDRNNIQKFFAECKNNLIKDNTIYISHSQEFSNFPEVYGIFIYLVKKLNKNVKEIKKFYQRDGKEVFVVYSTNVNK